MIVKRKIKDSNSVTFCDINCPKCNRIAKSLDYFRDNKETIECPNCGYESVTDKNTNKCSIRNGYGVLYAEFINKPPLYIVFDQPITKKDKEDLLKIFDDVFIIKEKSYFYLYEPNTDELIVLKGKNPKTFCEYVEEQRNQMDYDNFLSSYRYQTICSDDLIPFE